MEVASDEDQVFVKHIAESLSLGCTGVWLQIIKTLRGGFG